MQPPYFESKKFEQKSTLKVSMVMVFMDKTYDLLSDTIQIGENTVKKVVASYDIMYRYIQVAEKNKKKLI